MRSDDGDLFERHQIDAKRAISAHAMCCLRRAHTIDVHTADYTTILVPERSSTVFFPRIHFERSNTGESENFIPLVHISEKEQAILPPPLDTTNRPASTGQMLSHRTTLSAQSNKPNFRLAVVSSTCPTLLPSSSPHAQVIEPPSPTGQKWKNKNGKVFAKIYSHSTPIQTSIARNTLSRLDLNIHVSPVFPFDITILLQPSSLPWF
jgi:hypothetical protein